MRTKRPSIAAKATSPNWISASPLSLAQLKSPKTAPPGLNSGEAGHYQFYTLSRVIDQLLIILQSVFTSDISSGVLQQMAVKAGLAITQAKVLARLTATFKRFFE
ncbi:hypothetical protein D3C81_209080 [compost metagenome]